MNRSVETRLRKLEATSPDRRAHLFVIEGETEAERQAEIDNLMRSGEARASDSFIHTGVTRSAGSPFRCGPLADLMARVAACGRKIHEPRD
jgi:hypothetical protein